MSMTASDIKEHMELVAVKLERSANAHSPVSHLPYP